MRLFVCAQFLACGERVQTHSSDPHAVPDQAATEDSVADVPAHGSLTTASDRLKNGRAPLRDTINPRLLRRFKPVAQQRSLAVAARPRLTDLGRMLWYDPRLSLDGRVSCNSCHRLDDYGVDHQVTSPGVGGTLGRRNSPTVYNASGHIAQFWDGRASTLVQQAPGPILNLREMASTVESVEATLAAIPAYRELFALAFPGQRRAVTIDNVALALAEFEEGLVTRSRWDDYLGGDTHALRPAEVQGLRVFLEVGCMGCHTGPQMGGSMFQVAGFVESWPNQTDLGRYEYTKLASDRMVFKVPTLKNVVRTAPYFHDGSSRDLSEAVRTMGRRQLGIMLDDREIAAIVAFLDALTGTLPSAYIAAPTLPAMGGASSAQPLAGKAVP